MRRRGISETWRRTLKSEEQEGEKEKITNFKSDYGKNFPQREIRKLLSSELLNEEKNERNLCGSSKE